AYGYAQHRFNKIIFFVSVYNNGVRLFTLRESADGRTLQAGEFIATFCISSQLLRPGDYTLALGAWGDNDEWLWGTELSLFSITETWTNQIREPDKGIINGEFVRLNTGYHNNL
ncbi:MAG: hypothetical protein AAGC65_25895, partial [Mucilaginibacter sp.]|uniref:hypothetical protein n=1 Tax=Mucilaginibacter sp. TaxID=1882438 RepID=UPI0031A245E4